MNDAGLIQPPVPVLPRRPGRRSRVLPIAGLAIAALTVGAWVAAPALRSSAGPSRADGSAPASSPAGAAAASPSHASPSAVARSPRPSYELIAGPRPSGVVYVRDPEGAGVLPIDLATGHVGDRIGATNWTDRLLALPDRSFRCLCLTRVDQGGVTRLTIRIGAPNEPATKARPVLTLEGRTDPAVAADDQGDSVEVEPTVSPDGRLLAVGVSRRESPVWHRSVALIDVASARVVETVALPDAPSRDAPPLVGSIWAPAPRPRFAPDGRHLAVTIAAERPGASEPATPTTFVAALTGTRAARAVALPAPSPDADVSAVGCPAWTADFADADTLYGLCYGGGGATAAYLADIRAASARIVSLGNNPPQFGASLFDPASRSLFVWDPFSGRLVKLDAAAERVDGAVTLAAATATGPGGRSPFDRLRELLAGAIAPGAAAKILLEPALALSPDGRTLFAVAASGAMSEGATARTIQVVDATSLRSIGTWTVEPDVVSIAAQDGTLLVASIEPSGGSAGGSSGASAATVTILDAATGAERAVIRGLPDGSPVFVDPRRDLP